MNKEYLDRIEIGSKEKVSSIMGWYQDNVFLLQRDVFPMFVESGFIVMPGLPWDLAFERVGADWIHLELYWLNNCKPFAFWEFNCYTFRICNGEFLAKPGSSEYQYCMVVGNVERTLKYASVIFYTLMYFSKHFSKLIKIDESQTINLTKHEAKKLRKSGQPLKSSVITYVVKDFEYKYLNRFSSNGIYRTAARSKGFYRNTHNGAKVWVHPDSKYRNRGNWKQKKNKENKMKRNVLFAIGLMAVLTGCGNELDSKAVDNVKTSLTGEKVSGKEEAEEEALDLIGGLDSEVIQDELDEVGADGGDVYTLEDADKEALEIINEELATEVIEDSYGEESGDEGTEDGEPAYVASTTLNPILGILREQEYDVAQSVYDKGNVDIPGLLSVWEARAEERGLAIQLLEFKSVTEAFPYYETSCDDLLSSIGESAGDSFEETWIEDEFAVTNGKLYSMIISVYDVIMIVDSNSMSTEPIQDLKSAIEHEGIFDFSGIE